MPEVAPVEPIIAQYRFSLADYLALADAMSRRSWLRGVLIVVLWLVVVVTIIGLMSESWTQFSQALSDLVRLNNVPPHVYVLVGVIPALVFLIPQLRRLQARRVYRWNAIADQDVLLHIDSTGVRTTLPGRSSHTQWSAIRGMFRTKTHLFLPVSRREAIILPRRAFTSDAAFDAVEALAKNGIATGRQEGSVAGVETALRR